MKFLSVAFSAAHRLLRLDPWHEVFDFRRLRLQGLDDLEARLDWSGGSRRRWIFLERLDSDCGVKNLGVIDLGHLPAPVS